VHDPKQLANDFANGIRSVDERRPVWISSTTKRAYAPGIGPHTETETVRLVMTELATTKPELYDEYRLGVPYPSSPRSRCDLVIGHASASLAVEIKLLRFMGDNGKPNDNMLMHLLSPYTAHRSALTDCEKLAHAGFEACTAIMIYGFDYDDWPMDPAIDAFETLAARNTPLGARTTASFEGLVHPVHQRGRVFCWEIHAAAPI
jgi:hypothetical protein